MIGPIDQRAAQIVQALDRVPSGSWPAYRLASACRDRWRGTAPALKFSSANPSGSITP